MICTIEIVSVQGTKLESWYKIVSVQNSIKVITMTKGHYLKIILIQLSDIKVNETYIYYSDVQNIFFVKKDIQ